MFPKQVTASKVLNEGYNEP